MQDAATKIIKADKKLQNNSAEDFIPVACHYDKDTLLSKNGELIQIIQINGINSEHISHQLLNLREILNTTIKDNASTNTNFAFWLHTVRRRTNLDDQTEYKNLFSANLHEMWKQKNYWDDKFVNTLYISIVHVADSVKLNELNTIINAMSYGKIRKNHENYLTESSARLSEMTDKILHDLEEFGARKLGITYDSDLCYSDMVFVYRRIVRLNENKSIVPLGDLSSYIATDSYAVGGDKIEVTDDNDKKFTAILSIKEYHEESYQALDRFLQLPIELIATEIFYFVNKKYVVSAFQEQNNYLRVSGDSKLAAAKGLKEMIENDPDSRFCLQQIMVSIIGDTIEKLEENVSQASTNLAELGIVHVREDINLEQTFWAQLPGNFTFLRRIKPTTLRNVTALASLHNFPTGAQYNIWGRAVTLLRTEKATPYFMNFHNIDNRGNTAIFGNKHTGKTILTNFLISESTKFDPTILYLATNNDSQIFIEALGGKWSQSDQNIINPFLLEDNIENKLFAYEFLKIISNHYMSPVTSEDLQFLEDLVNKIFTFNLEDRILSKILADNKLFKAQGSNIQARLKEFQKGGLYVGIFDNQENFSLTSKGTYGINLYRFSDQYFTLKYLPKDPKLMNQFSKDLLLNQNIKTAITYALQYHFNLIDNNPKVLALDNALSLLDMEKFGSLINEIYYNTTKNNGVIITNLPLEQFFKQKIELCQAWNKLIDTQIILACDIRQAGLKQKLQLTDLEVGKLNSINLISRLFLIKQKGESILVELSIGAMKGFVRMLSSKEDELTIYSNIIKNHPGAPENWLDPLYQEFEK